MNKNNTQPTATSYSVEVPRTVLVSVFRNRFVCRSQTLKCIQRRYRSTLNSNVVAIEIQSQIQITCISFVAMHSLRIS